MTFTAAGSLTSAENSVTGTSTTFSLTTTTAGDFILLSLANNSQPATQVSSSRVTWTKLTSDYSFTTTSPTMWINHWIGQVSSAGADTVTVTYAASMAGNNSRFDAREFHSTLGNVALDVTGTVTSSGGTSSWATLTPTGNGRLYWGWCEDSGSAAGGSTSGFVYEPDSHSNAEGYCLSVSAAYTPVWGDSGMIAGVMILVSEGGTAAAGYVPQLVPPGWQSPAAWALLKPPQALAAPAVITLPAAASLDGEGTLTAAGVLAGTALLSGTGTMTAAGVIAGTAALSGSGTLSVPGVALGYSAALSGSGTLAAAGVLAASAALDGEGSLSETVTLGYSASLSGTGSLSVPGVVLGYSASLSGTGSLSVPGVILGYSAALSGLGLLSVSGEVLGYSAALSGSGTLTAAGVLAGSASLDGEGTITAGVTLGYSALLAGSGTMTAAGVLAGTGTLTGTGAITVPGVTLGYSAVLAGTGTLTGTGGISGLFLPAASLDGEGTLTALGVTLGCSAALAGQGSMAAGVTLGYSAALAGSGSLAVSPLTLGYAAALAGSGALTAAGTLFLPGAAALSGSGTLGAAWSLYLPGAATLSGSGSLAAAWILGPSALLAGQGVLTASGLLAGQLTGAAVLAGTGLLAAAAGLITPVPFTGEWHASPLAPRWHAVPLAPRWKVARMQYPPVSALSVEYVPVHWTSDLAGTEVDPTGATAGQPALAVQFAVPVSSGNFLAPAEPVTWYTATWLLGTNIAGYVAQCPVGPAGGSPAGLVQLTAGMAYDLHSRILGNPEQPTKFAGTISAY